MTVHYEDLISAVKARDKAAIRYLLESGASIDQTDDYGWSPLCWAAAQGEVETAQELINRGANPFHCGKDWRTPYLIALAAMHVEAAELLKGAEEQRGGDVQQRSSRLGELRPYCRAYLLEELRQFPGWQAGLTKESETAGLEPLVDDSIVFLHRNLAVTRSLWPGEQVVFSSATKDWQKFCDNVLHFHPPSDSECLPAGSANATAEPHGPMQPSQTTQ